MVGVEDRVRRAAVRVAGREGLVVCKALFGNAVAVRVDFELVGDAEWDDHGVLDVIDEVDGDDEGEAVGGFVGEAASDDFGVILGGGVIAVGDEGGVLAEAAIIGNVVGESEIGTVGEEG